ncbi:MAG TPA: pyridoxine 5'-phosphate synthase [Candidatus Binatia bacterium]|nr:pyridoxine 5'-phosphate synthase [Candidatus Binatia bacterium]
MSTLRLGVNVDHVATLRQARRTPYPDLLEAALAAERGGAGGITVHLREDRRHIQEDDVVRLRDGIATKLNLELALSEDIIVFACRTRSRDACIVPERREELTTEGGLAVAGRERVVGDACKRLADAGIRVSLFIDPIDREVEAAAAVGAPVIEIHTGAYAEAADPHTEETEIARIRAAAAQAAALGLEVNAGHGLTVENVGRVAAIEQIVELNIGHSIVSRAVFVGMEQATREMLGACRQARRG